MIENTKKLLSFRDIILMTVASNFGIRWIAIAAGIGPSSIFLWLFGALLFFIPLTIITAQMSRVYPEEGGLYAWVKKTLGEEKGFMVAWLYWVCNVFFYPAALIFLASNFAYVIGKPELTTNATYITLTSLAGFWIIVVVSLLGMRVSKHLINAGGILGGFVPVLLLIFFSIWAYLKWGQSATDFHWNQFLPGGKMLHNISALAMIMFAMAGIEVIATFANRVKNPRRDLYWGLVVGSILIFGLYIFGTFAMNILATPETLQKTSGVMQAFMVVNHLFDLSWFSHLIASFLTFAELGAIIVWLLAPVIMFFKCSPAGILPAWLHKTDKNETPVNALLFQGFFVSLVIIITSVLSSVNAMYQVLVLMSTILYFVPYLFLSKAYICSISVLKIPKWQGYLLASCVFISVLLGIIVSFVPSEDLKTAHDLFFYEAELILGPVFFIGAGWLLYKFRRV